MYLMYECSYFVAFAAFLRAAKIEVNEILTALKDTISLVIVWTSSLPFLAQI